MTAELLATTEAGSFSTRAQGATETDVGVADLADCDLSSFDVDNAEFSRLQEGDSTTGAIACYSRHAVGSSYRLDPPSDEFYVMGLIEGVRGSYTGRIFQPKGYEDKDISKAPVFSLLCSCIYPACESDCWAGGDTGGFYGRWP